MQASAVPIAENTVDELIDELLNPNGLTPEQKKCIEDAVEKSKQNNPELAKWLNEVDSARKVLQAKAKKCRELENPLEQR